MTTKTRTSRAWLAMAMFSTLAAGGIPTAQAQNSGALPIYRCVAADGASSRMSRTPCAAGETGKAQHSVAAIPQAKKPEITHQIGSIQRPVVVQQDETRIRPHAPRRRFGRR